MTPTPDPLVRAALRAGHAPAGPHPDAEVLGLYAERALEGDERRGVETHVAACLRCQAIVAEMAVTAPEHAPSAGTAGAAGVLGWFSGWRWVVPVASLAAVAIVAVWIGQPPSERLSRTAPANLDTAVNGPGASAKSALVPPASQAQPTTPAATAAEQSLRMAQGVETESRSAEREATPADSAASSNSAEPARRALAVRGAENAATAGERLTQPPAATLADAVTPPTPAPAAPAAAAASTEARAEKSMAQAPAVAAEAMPAPLAAPAAGAAAPSARARSGATFRVTAGRLETSSDAGRLWRQATTPAGLRIVAVAEVSPRVAWAIGEQAVLRTIDGETWTQVSVPPGAPFSAVTASDADRATVIATTGALYATTDGGRTWRRAP